ncbi:MAG: hypothetical protein QOI91_2554 [Solirubrobacteraceae bacterium]|jgi:hypothetical protein|nr:hypothetical protein [Solirubrobacteraceae bacterium]
MGLRVQVMAIVASGVLLLVVLELVRRRRLLERYALLWLFSALVLLGLSAWQGLLSSVADTIGIRYPPSALFVIAFAFILVLLLHFSTAVSRLADQSKVLAQRVALLEQRLDAKSPTTDEDAERAAELADVGR